MKKFFKILDFDQWTGKWTPWQKVLFLAYALTSAAVFILVASLTILVLEY